MCSLADNCKSTNTPSIGQLHLTGKVFYVLPGLFLCFKKLTSFCQACSLNRSFYIKERLLEGIRHSSVTFNQRIACLRYHR